MEPKKLKFRFKTSSEFREEFGDGWRYLVRRDWVHEMDDMLGMILHDSYYPEIVKTLCGLQEQFLMETNPKWRISIDMIKQII